MYELIRLPEKFKKDIYTFSKAEAKDYFKWIQEIKSFRLQILREKIKVSYPNWDLKYDRSSLRDLSNWFFKNITSRNINEIDIRKFQEQISHTPEFNGVIPLPFFELTDETISICFDVYLYLGDTFINSFQNTKWGQQLGSTNNIDYGVPVIISSNYKIPINLRRVTESLAYDFLKNNSAYDFLEIYDDVKLKFGNG